MDIDRREDRDRRSFLRTACLGGMCMRARRLDGGNLPGALSGASQSQPDLPRMWIRALLPMLSSVGADDSRRILKPASASHFLDLGMSDTLDPFRGDLPAFLDFLRSEWGWIVDYDPEAGVIEVNENKSRCVCPLVSEDHGDDLGALCYCSEGFAERMFGEVTGRPVRAEVTESILRGGQRCRYRIELGA